MEQSLYFGGEKITRNLRSEDGSLDATNFVVNRMQQEKKGIRQVFRCLLRLGSELSPRGLPVARNDHSPLRSMIPSHRPKAFEHYPHNVMQNSEPFMFFHHCPFVRSHSSTASAQNVSPPLLLPFIPADLRVSNLLADHSKAQRKAK